MTTYHIDVDTFDMLRLNLRIMKDANLYYNDAQITRKGGKGLYALKSIKGAGATEFRNIVEEGQQQQQHPKVQKQQPKVQKQQLNVQEQPTEPTVVNRQHITFDNPGFEDDQRLTDIRTVHTELRAEGEPELDYNVPRLDLKEIRGLPDNIRRIDSNLAEARIELRKEEGDINRIKNELERERSRDEPDQNKIQHLEEEITEREESYFANQRRYRNLNVDMKNQVERIRSIIRSERPLGDRLRVIQEGRNYNSFYNHSYWINN